jgi:UDP-2,4-diacetamido-2,4,6-trideoxy-beta-L-altropyranose hydrolase
MPELPLLLIRADAGTHLGTGHLMRCLALAQAWHEKGGKVQFALALVTPPLEARLGGEGFDIVRVDSPPGSALDAADTIAIAREAGAVWLVVDGYHFDAAYQQAIKGSGLNVLAIDDYRHAKHYWADLVLNQNISACNALYPGREAYTRLLLGTHYALLRREFWPWRGWQREIPDKARRVLVTMGGADPGNVTLKALDALQQIQVKDLEVKVVIGGSFQHRETLAGRDTVGICELIENPSDMPGLMAWADLAISAAGSTCWELAFMQLPSVLLILADNQRSNAIGLDSAGAALNLGWHEDLRPEALAHALEQLLAARETRAAMAAAGRSLVDGKGSCRVVALMSEIPIRVRPVSQQDCALLFTWANDPVTRQMSFHSDPIQWAEHQQWFVQVTHEPHSVFVIAEWLKEGRWIPIGQARIAQDGIVSISIAPEYRSQRLARPALQAAVACYRARFPEKVLTAYIKPENRASQGIFRQAGFEYRGEAGVWGQACLKYEYRPSGNGVERDSVEGDGHVQDW